MSRAERYALAGAVIVAAGALTLVLKGTPRTLLIVSLTAVIVIGSAMLLWDGRTARSLRSHLRAAVVAGRDRKRLALWNPTVSVGSIDDASHHATLVLTLIAPGGWMFRGEHPYGDAVAVCEVIAPDGRLARSAPITCTQGEARLAFPQDFDDWPEPRTFPIPDGEYLTIWTVLNRPIDPPRLRFIQNWNRIELPRSVQQRALTRFRHATRYLRA